MGSLLGLRHGRVTEKLPTNVTPTHAMKLGEQVRGVVIYGLVGVFLYGSDTSHAPPYHDHVPENAPVRGLDMGAQTIQAAVTSVGNGQGVIVL
jgi:hypothetical protein